MTARKMKPHEVEATTLNDLARDCLEEASGDAPKATALYAERINDDPSLKARLLEPFFMDACAMRISAANAAIRQAIIKASSRPDAGARRLSLLGQSNAESWLDFPVYGGKPMRLCTKDELQESAHRYYAQGSDMVRKSAFFKAVAARMGKGEKVSDRFSNSELDALFQKSAA